MYFNNQKMEYDTEYKKGVKMNKIKELLKDENSILVFDVDGVLAIMEWGIYNHFILNDSDWNKACEEGKIAYNEEKVSGKMKKFLENKDMSRIYVITRAISDQERALKKEFANKYYNILKENIFYVKDNKDKVIKLLEIRNKYPELQDYQIIMVEDTVSILNDVMEKTNFSTAHISSFLDI